MFQILKRNNKGFTLTEVIVVVVIIGLLTAIGIPSYKAVKISAERKIVETNLKILNEALLMWYELSWPYSFNPYHIEKYPSLPSQGTLIEYDYISNYIHGPKNTDYIVRWDVDNYYKKWPPVEFYAVNYSETIGGYDLSSGFSIDELPWNN